MTTPTWENDIAALFTAPYWIEPPEDRRVVGTYWVERMGKRSLDLRSYDAVSEPATAQRIYDELSSYGMPPAARRDSSEKFPPEALKKFKDWMDGGYPVR